MAPDAERDLVARGPPGDGIGQIGRFVDRVAVDGSDEIAQAQGLGCWAVGHERDDESTLDLGHQLVAEVLEGHQDGGVLALIHLELGDLAGLVAAAVAVDVFGRDELAGVAGPRTQPVPDGHVAPGSRPW